MVPSCTRTAQCSLSDLSRTENLKPYYFYKIAHNVRTQMEIILTTQHPTCITYARGTIKMLEWETWHCKTGLARKYQWYISMIHIKIFFLYFWYFRYFQNINNYYYYLLTSLIHAYLTQTAQVPKLLDAAKILTKILTLWVGSNNVAEDRHRRTAHVIRRT